VFPYLPISKSWWRGARAFSAIASAKADEDPDSGIFEQLWFSELSSSLSLLHYFLAKAKNIVEKGTHLQFFSQTYRQYQPPSSKSNLASVPLFANLAELVERG